MITRIVRWFGGRRESQKLAIQCGVAAAVGAANGWLFLGVFRLPFTLWLLLNLVVIGAVLWVNWRKGEAR